MVALQRRSEATLPRLMARSKLAAIILDDGELDRVLAHQGWPASWPKTKPARAPPARAPDEDTDSQVDPRGDKWDGRQDFPAGDFPA